MRAMRVPAAGEPFEAVEVPIPEPSATEVRVAVEACGICHSDAFVKSGAHPAVEYPRIPGHEIAGRIDAVGDDVERWEPDDRVGVGWHGGHCFTCDPCRRGDFQGCERGDITGLTFDGGYAEYATVPAEAVGAIPDALGAVEAAPLLWDRRTRPPRPPVRTRDGLRDGRALSVGRQGIARDVAGG
jgi:NADPH2:quinone reductase